MEYTTWVCRVKEGWDEAGRCGQFYIRVTPPDNLTWAVVVWDDDPDGDPSLFKEAGLEVKMGEVWEPLRKVARPIKYL